MLTGLCRAGDLLLMVAAALATGLLLRRMSGVPPWGEFIVVSCIAITVTRTMAQRQKIGDLAALLDPLGHLSRIALCVVSGGVSASFTLLLLHHHGPDLPYMVTQPLAWTLASGATVLAFRTSVAWRLQGFLKTGRLSTQVALIGANAASMKFVREAASDPRLNIVGIYDDRTTRLPESLVRTWLRGNVTDLVTMAKRQSIDAVVIALPLESTQRIAEMRSRLAGIATDVFITADGAAPSFGGAQFTQLGASPVLSVSSRPLKDWPAFKKAMFDRVAGAVLLILAAPLMAVLAVVVKLDSRGPALFRQEREGLNGVPFTMFKFRTMYDRPEGAFAQATTNDRRVTRSGHWLRRLSLDELPQLLNILRGDMSLVGPRPHYAATRAGSRLFSEVVPHYQARHRMKPGLTGWAQVQGLRGETRTEQDITDRVAQDLYYIDNWSLGLDLQIIGRTLLREIVSNSGRAY